jgi:fatty acid desaturase
MTVEPATAVPAVSRSGDPARPRNLYVSAYAELSRRVQAEGMLRRRYGYYWTCIVLAVGAFAAIWAGVVLVGNSWFQLLLAAALAVVSAQFGFLGHDAAHRQIFSSPRWNEWCARVLSGAFTGLSYGWWMRKHNRHHSGPNQEDRDPDITSGVLAMTPSAGQGRTGWSARIGRHQGWLFYLLMPLEGLNLHIQSVRTVLARGPLKHRAVEATFLALRLGGYLAALCWLLPPGKAAAFAGVQLGLFGVLLAGAFATNHIGMPIVPAGMKVDFLRRQVLMSRNVNGGRVTDFLMGGLNYQIEHHLFPSMPRPSLKRAQRLVREHCVAHGVTYTQTSLPQAFVTITRYLNAVGGRYRDPFRCPLVTLYRS